MSGMTNVSELIEELSKLPGTLPVILSSDAEGNSKSPYADLWVGWIDTGYNEYEGIHEDDWDEEQYAEEVKDGTVIQAVTLYPV